MQEEGLDVDLQLLFPVTDAARMLADGSIDLLAGAAHAPLYVDHRWSKVKLLCTLARHTYWFLVVRDDSAWTHDDIGKLHDLTIGAAPGPDVTLRQLLIETGGPIDDRNVTVAPVPGTDRDSISFGVTAAEALANGRIDAFWANGMGATVAVSTGVGRVIHDARRDGLVDADYTFPSFMAATTTVDQRPEVVAAATRAIVRAQQVLVADPDRATAIGKKHFPPMEAGLIADLIRRDGPWYRPEISARSVDALNDFARKAGLLDEDAVPYEAVVAAEAAKEWKS